MCKAINAACDGRLMQADSGGHCIGFDFSQIFNFKTHSSGLVFIRLGEHAICCTSRKFGRKPKHSSIVLDTE